jgi:hypothetical protein
LNKCNIPNDDGICALLIDTLSILCESEVVDMISIYKAIMPQFRREKRLKSKINKIII